MRSFSSAFITIQSSSPRTSFVSFAGSVPRFAARVGKPSAVLSFVLGFDGSCSRMTRSISSMPAFSSSLLRERRAAGQQFVEQHAQRVDVAAGVDVELVELGLLRAHVLQRADDRAEAGVQRLLGQLLPGRLGHAEVDHLGHRPVVVQRDQHVGRLDVAMDDALLMGVLDRLADGDEQFQPLPRRQVVLVAVLGDRHALDQFHDEVAAGRALVVPPSSTLAMFGWSISARACRSASKRASTCLESIPA